MGAPQCSLVGAELLFQGGLALSIYAYWRVTQRAMRQAQAAETERVRNEQRVQAARLLALQSRVEPQMLFDALGRIGELHVREPQAADALLADLIALLRAMLPGARADNSTVEREFALVDAWLRVTRNAAHGAARVQLRMRPARSRSASRRCWCFRCCERCWPCRMRRNANGRLSAEAAGDRLIVTLQANADAESPKRLTCWRVRTCRRCTTGSPSCSGASRASPCRAGRRHSTLDLPRLQEDSR